MDGSLLIAGHDPQELWRINITAASQGLDALSHRALNELRARGEPGQCPLCPLCPLYPQCPLCLPRQEFKMAISTFLLQRWNRLLYFSVERGMGERFGRLQQLE